MTVAKQKASSDMLPKYLASHPRLSQWLTVQMDELVCVRVGKVEFGQGILTALAQIVADGLSVPLERIRMLPTNTATSPDQGLTAGSMSVFDSTPALSVVCANVRSLFLQEAARRWNVDVEEIVVDAGAISVRGTGAKTSYGALAGAVNLDVDADPALTGAEPSEGGLTGQSTARLDLPGKIAGRPAYIHDMRLPDQLFGRVVRPPSVGAQLLHVDEAAAGLGDVRLVRDGSFLGVVASTEAEAERAVEQLRAAATWKEQPCLPDEHDIATFLRQGPHETIPVIDDGPVPTGGVMLRASYSRPFLTHGSIAPSCGVARWEPDARLSVWSHSQGVHRLRNAIAQALDIERTTVTVEHVESAGCYGHNGADDAAFDAVLLARAVPGRPVHVQWNRHDELAWGHFGSAMVADVEGSVDDQGRLQSWDYEVWSQGHTARPGYAAAPGLLAGEHLDHPLKYPAPADPPLRGGGGTVRNARPIYQVGHRRIVGHRLLETPIRSSALRSLGSFLNVFAIESFMDELAEAVGQDPVAFRLGHLDDPRGREVLERAAEAGRWGTPTDEAVGRGVGFARYKDKGAYCAVVAEVEAKTTVRVRRLNLAVDVGRVINPDGVRNQVEGGATQATSWTLMERVRFDRSRITSTDWESYPILKFSEAPKVQVEIVSRPDEKSVGSGEAAQGPTAAAIGNALAAAVGVRVRDLPLTPEAVVKAIEEQE